ncbi:hypothetical protein [Myxacorys almedinensis]|uniref:Uncharacterized protein n=1 Tax=Myxacorys almedinensis A TaxID=2690445 RepID=A0A8J7YZC6_9CYAN|nr:hypothetical protein [Myxacorys almedinensis]NDJ17332.1 hypothetical protein [Myxacorys almedinensis A]
MANLNDRNIYDRDNNPNPNPDPNPSSSPENLNPSGDYHVVDPDPVNYRQGYVEGKAVEQHRYEANQQIRDNDNAGRGLLVGILATGLLALVGASFYFLTQRPTPPTRTIVVPSAAPSVSPSPSPSPEVRERVIERDRIVPVPQQSAPAPNIITIPQPAAPTQSAPAAPQPAAPESSAQPSPSSDSTQSAPTTEAPDEPATSSPEPQSGQ